MRITNTDGTVTPLSRYLRLAGGATSATFSLRYHVDRAAKIAIANAQGGVVVRARKSGTTDAFANVATTTLNLTPAQGSFVDYDFQITAPNNVALSSVRLGYAPL